MDYVRDESLRRAVASLPCVCCGVEGWSQAAHSNLAVHGKGMGKKSTDAALMALCASRPGVVGCHDRLDQHIGMSKATAVDLTYQWIAATYIELVRRGLLRVEK